MSTTSLSTTAAIILAAGQGTRMKSGLPKVLHAIAGKPIVHYPVRAALEAGCAEVVVVVGHGRERVQAYLSSVFGEKVKTAVQEQQRGTGDAARAGMTALSPHVDLVLIFVGDAPLLMVEDIASVGRALTAGTTLALATCVFENPSGYGRILRDQAGQIVEIREQKDLRTDAERGVKEINPAIYAAERTFMEAALAELSPNNAQGEYYLTDIVAAAARQKLIVAGVPSRAEVVVGINDRDQLADAEKTMMTRIIRRHRALGVTVHDGARIEDGVEIGQDAIIETGAVLRGNTRIGRNAFVDVGCVLTNAIVDDEVALKPYSVVTDAHVRARAQIGPFSHLRPESDIGEDAHVGNFVETKKTTMGKGAKANHLAYLGDGIIGAQANIGAGTIFCNYDGYLKHTTTIGARAFIGSDSQLVAPVTVGDGAYVGTGTTVTMNVPPNALAISRVRQENKEQYAEKLRAKLQAAKDAKKK